MSAAAKPDPVGFELEPGLALGEHYGLSMEQYLALPAVSQSVLSTLIERCPRAAWFGSHLNPNRVRQATSEMDVGTIAHSILLEGSIDCVAEIDPEKHAGKNGGIPDGWTNPAIRAARDEARAAGKTPVLKKHMPRIRAMVDSATTFIESLRTTEPAVWRAFQPDGGDSELTMVWQDGPTLCRIRHDRISKDRRVAIDVKCTGMSAEPDSWSRQLVRMGYDFGAGFYRRGVKALHGVEHDQLFLVIEDEPPHLCSLIGIDPAGLALGSEKVAAALRDWQRCVQRNEWPGYANRVAYVELPGYLAAQWEEQQLNAAAGGNWRVLFPELAEKVNA